MITRSLNITLLLVWALFLLWLLTFGQVDLVRLLHPRLWWVLGIAAGVLIFFLLSLVIPHGYKDKGNSLLIELPGALILVVPLLYFATAKDARLDAASLKNRMIQNESGMFLNNLPSIDIFDQSETGDMTFSKILKDPEKYQSQEVDVVCQSFVHENLPQNSVMCYRYLITCCAADALPAFLLVRHPEGVAIENNQWMKVNGSLSIVNYNDMETPTIDMTEFEYVEEPEFPWAM